MTDTRPLAHISREEHAVSLFPYKDMSPEEYAGRYAHEWLCSSFDTYRYQDAALTEWITEMHRILHDSPKLKELQLRYYTEEEMAEQKRKMWENL